MGSSSQTKTIGIRRLRPTTRRNLIRGTLGSMRLGFRSRMRMLIRCLIVTLPSQMLVQEDFLPIWCAVSFRRSASRWATGSTRSKIATRAKVRRRLKNAFKTSSLTVPESTWPKNVAVGTWLWLKCKGRLVHRSWVKESRETIRCLGRTLANTTRSITVVERWDRRRNLWACLIRGRVMLLRASSRRSSLWKQMWAMTTTSWGN